MEESADVRESRRLLHRADRLLWSTPICRPARREFEAAFKLWRKVLDLHPELVRDETAFTLVDAARAYRSVLRQLDEPFPKQFVLQSLIDAHKHEF